MKKLKLTYRYYDYIERIDKKLIMICSREPDEDGMLKVYDFEGNPDRIMQPFSTDTYESITSILDQSQLRFMYISHATGLLNWYGWGKMVDDALYLNNATISYQVNEGFMEVEEIESDDETIKYYDEQYDKEGTVLAKPEESVPEEESKDEEGN